MNLQKGDSPGILKGDWIREQDRDVYGSEDNLDSTHQLLKRSGEGVAPVRRSSAARICSRVA
jgi:hypothetical protein